MPKYLISRTLPNAGDLSPEDLQGIASTSCGVVRDLNTDYHWIQSFVTDDKIYCVHIAPDEATVREHARRGGFPVDEVMEVRTIIDPTTAEGAPAIA